MNAIIKLNQDELMEFRRLDEIYQDFEDSMEYTKKNDHIQNLFHRKLLIEKLCFVRPKGVPSDSVYVVVDGNFYRFIAGPPKQFFTLEQFKENIELLKTYSMEEIILMKDMKIL